MAGRCVAATVVVVAALAFAMPPVPEAAGQGAGKIVLRFGTGVNPGTLLQTSVDRFAELVAKKTANRVEVKIFPSSQLGGEKDQLEAVALGTQDMTLVSTALLASQERKYSVIDLPYLFQSYEHAHRAIDGPVGKQLDEVLLKSKGVRTLAWYDSGFRFVFTAKHEIKKLADFKGLKIRVPQAEVYIRTFQLLGASPTPLPYPELYGAAQTGAVDGFENISDQTVAAKLYEVAKYGTKTYHIWLALNVLVNDKKFRALSPDVQQAMQEAGREAMIVHRAAALRVENDALAKLAQLGMKINEIDRAPLREAVRPLWKEIGDKYKVHDLITLVEQAQ
jgi:tripartite ATP-independent transporter DctP family solute receptor